jgi:hypothetical protein
MGDSVNPGIDSRVKRFFAGSTGCTWTGNLEPGHFRVWKGAFGDGKIDLFAEWDDEGCMRIRSRLTWSDITADSAHWESARSSDGGKTWQVHWVIDFRRRR